MLKSEILFHRRWLLLIAVLFSIFPIQGEKENIDVLCGEEYSFEIPQFDGRIQGLQGESLYVTNPFQYIGQNVNKQQSRRFSSRHHFSFSGKPFQSNLCSFYFSGCFVPTLPCKVIRTTRACDYYIYALRRILI